MVYCRLGNAERGSIPRSSPGCLRPGATDPLVQVAPPLHAEPGLGFLFFFSFFSVFSSGFLFFLIRPGVDTLAALPAAWVFALIDMRLCRSILVSDLALALVFCRKTGYAANSRLQ